MKIILPDMWYVMHWKSFHGMVRTASMFLVQYLEGKETAKTTHKLQTAKVQVELYIYNGIFMYKHHHIYWDVSHRILL